MANINQILQEQRAPDSVVKETEQESQEQRDVRLFWEKVRNSEEVQKLMNFFDSQMRGLFLRAGTMAVENPLTDPKIKDALLFEAGVLLKVINTVKHGQYGNK